MTNDKNLNIVTKLFTLTQTKKITWAYLDTHRPLMKALKLEFDDDTGMPLTPLTSRTLVSSNLREKSILNDKDLLEPLTRLLNFIRSEYPTVDKVIDELLNL